MKKSDIKVHDFEGVSPSKVYDQIQIDESIKDGDVINIGNGNVAILLQSWPTVVVGEIEYFHRLQSGFTFESIDNGKYAASAAKARQVSKDIKGLTKLQAKADDTKNNRREVY